MDARRYVIEAATLVLFGLVLIVVAGFAVAAPEKPTAGDVKKACAPVKASESAVTKARAAYKVRARALARASSDDRAAAAKKKDAASKAVQTAKRDAAKATKACKDKQRERATNARDWTRYAVIVSMLVFGGAGLLLWDLVIGTDNRVSTSKTVAAVWTTLLAGTLFAFVAAKLHHYPQALDKIMHSGLAGQYALLIGGPLGAAIASKGIVANQVKEKKITHEPEEEPAKRTEILQVVEGDGGQTDLGNFQYVLFNLVAVVYFAGTVIQSPLSGLPHIPDILLGLTRVAAAGYVTKKALPTVVEARRTRNTRNPRGGGTSGARGGSR